MTKFSRFVLMSLALIALMFTVVPAAGAAYASRAYRTDRI